MTITNIDDEFDDHDGENGRDGEAGKEAVRQWMLSQEPPMDPDDKEIPIDRDAVNYGHCVSFGLSGCDINDPEATYDIMEDEGISPWL